MKNRDDRTAASSTMTLPGGRRAAPLAPGTIVGGNLRIVSCIGAGGMGTVYLAVDAGLLGRSCAVKVLDNVEAGSASHGRFLTEARIMASLRHPNIVPVSRFGTDADTGFDFYVMDEYLPSGAEVARICRDMLHCPCPAVPDNPAPLTLASLTDGGKALPEEAVASIALQILSAMEAAHSLTPPVVHRDIKPSNILFASDGRAVLSDFGIAKRIVDSGEATSEWTAPNANPGTWAYSAPEQRRGEPVGIATDYYAFGLVLFRALTGGMPNRAAALPTDIAPKVSREWTRLFPGLLEEDPAKRLADAGRVRSLVGRITADAARRKSRRNAWRITAHLMLGAVLAAALAVGVVRGLQNRTDMVARQPSDEDLADKVGEIAPEEVEPASPFDHKGWCSQYAQTLKETLKVALVAPAPDAAGRIVVRAGESLLSGDIDPRGVLEILLDGGTLVFSPPAEELRDLVRQCEDFAANAQDGDSPPEDILPERREWLTIPIAVTARGGHLNTVDGDIVALVAGAVRRAVGTEKATLDVFGLSSIVINRGGIDPGLRITGAGQIADIGNGGKLSNRRWFDDDDPLEYKE